jgi:predicted transcriptional regulator
MSFRWNIMEYAGGEYDTSRELRTKAKMLDVIQRMPEDGTIDDAIYRLGVLKAVAEGLEDAEQGRGRDHDEVFDELLNDKPAAKPLRLDRLEG